MSNFPRHNAQKLPPWVQQSLTWIGRLGHPVILSTIATSAVVLGARSAGGLQGLELGMYDRLMRQRPTLPPDERILVVGINETDIQRRGEFPIQDSTVVELLDILQDANPRTIGLDMFRDVPIGEGHEDLLAHLQGSDRVVSVCKVSSPDSPGVPPPTGVPDMQVGFADLVVDSGGTLRRSLLTTQPPAEATPVTPHLCSDPEARLASLGFQMALRYLSQEGIDLEVTPDQQYKLGDTVLPRLGSHTGGYRNVDATGYQLLLNYRAARNAVPEVSLMDVLSGQVPSEQIRDRIVLIGMTTPEAKDDFYTPYSGGLRDNQKMPGVIVHAQSISQILGAVLDDRPLLWSWPTFWEGVWVVLWGVGGALFAWYVRRPVRFTGGAVVLLGGLYGICYLLFLKGGWIPLVPPALALVLAAGGVVLLDRFNKSDYGKAVYKQMKSLLRLDIEIDQAKVGQQVAEITETEYFASLQQQARQLRKRQDALESSATDKGANEPTPPPSDSAETMDDYVDNLKRQARRLKHPDGENDGTAKGE